MSKKVAVIDLGSNSARMVIFERTSRLGFYIIGEFKSKLRLGSKSYETDGLIQNDGMQKGLQTFVEFKKLIKRYKVSKVLAVGTSALRDAPNSKDFINLISKKCSINLKIITGEEEAIFGAIAAINLLQPIKNATTIDIGGGSTELALIQSGRVKKAISLNIGTVRLKELFFDKDISAKTNDMQNFINDILNNIPNDFKNENIIAIGGSLRAISNAIMENLNYPLKTVHNFSYNFNKYEDFITNIITAQEQQLQNMKIKKDRFDTINAGAFIFKNFVNFLGAKTIFTSGVGVREGVFLKNLMPKNPKFPKNFNPSLTSILDRFNKEQGANVAKIAVKIFKTLKPIHNIEDVYINELQVAAKLCNVGNKISYYSMHNHTGYIVLNALNFGFSHKQKALISTIIQLHGKKSIQDSNDCKNLIELLPNDNVVTWLSYILEMSKILDKSNENNILFELNNFNLEICGIKSDLIIKDNLKKLNKPTDFLIIFR